MTDTARGHNGPTDFLPKLLTVWREGYRLADLRADALAGLTVAIVALPLSMAIAIASGVGPERGLFTAIVGGFLVSALGGSRYQIGGPAGAFIVLVAACVTATGLEGLILATILSGLVLIGAGLLRLGTYIRYIPYPVTVGFTAGIAVIIFASQLREMFGLTLPGAEPGEIIAKVQALWAARGTVTWAALAVVGLTAAVIQGLKRVRPHWPGMLIAVGIASVAVAMLHLPVATIGSRCPKVRQTLLFSATYPEGLAQISRRFLRDPKEVTLAAQPSAAKIRQRFYEVTEDQRLHAVGLLLNHWRPERTLAFCNTKVQCRDLVAVLQAQGVAALALHGDLEQRERDQVLIQFANRSCSVLVATDVAARGLDIANLAAVINVDVTPDPEVHIHRIGRTGRGDAQGLALNLASMDEMGYVGKIEVLQGRESTWFPLADLKPTGNGPLVPPMATIQIVGGRKEKIRAGDVLGALTGDMGYTREQVGKINVNDFSTYVAVDRAIAAQAAARLNSGRVKGKSVKARLIEDERG